MKESKISLNHQSSRLSGHFYITLPATLNPALQGMVLPLTPQDSLVIYHTWAKHCAPAPLPTLQLLLFEVVPTA